MKIIELLNKIANGEEVPEKIKYMGYIWSYEKKSKDYFNGSEKLFYFYTNNIILCLNDEVEILKDEEEIDIQSIEEIKEVFIESSSCGEDVKFLARKYNLILQVVKQLDKNIKELR